MNVLISTQFNPSVKSIEVDCVMKLYTRQTTTLLADTLSFFFFFFFVYFCLFLFSLSNNDKLWMADFSAFLKENSIWTGLDV